MTLVHHVGWDPRFVERSEWLWPLAHVARALADCADWPELAHLDALYAAQARAHGGAALCFRPDVRARRRGGAVREIADRYDGRIALRGEVPTRARDWHDLLNALCFSAFPHSKYALHARQCAALQQPGGRPGVRTREQDALTLFDEGGVAIAADADLVPELQAALDAGELLPLARAEREGRARAVPFGHALFEHLVEGVPCPGSSARVLALERRVDSHDEAALIAAVDAALALELARSERFCAPREAAHVRLDALARTRLALNA